MSLKKIFCGVYLLLSVYLGLGCAIATNPEDYDVIKNAIKQLNLQLNLEQVTILEIPELNLYKVIDKKNLEVFYVSKQGKYFFYGDLLDLTQNNKRMRNITETSKMSIRKSEISNFSKQQSIIFKPDPNVWGLRKPIGSITVFNDVTCPYGNRFHKELLKANKLGLEIRYIFYPRAGIGSEGDNKAKSIWCAKDRKLALNLATEGKDFGKHECKTNSIETQFNFARKIGINATPSTILSDGSLVPGYMSSEELIALVSS